jgi:hypothetical protein
MDEEITARSFSGTLAFGRLTLFLLFVACLVVGSKIGMAFVIASSACAYLAQMLFTADARGIGARACMVASLFAGVIAFAFFLGS